MNCFFRVFSGTVRTIQKTDMSTLRGERTSGEAGKRRGWNASVLSPDVSLQGGQGGVAEESVTHSGSGSAGSRTSVAASTALEVSVLPYCSYTCSTPRSLHISFKKGKELFTKYLYHDARPMGKENNPEHDDSIDLKLSLHF